MVLGSHQLEAGILSGLFAVMAYVDYNLLPGCRSHAQRLPGVQTAKAPVHVLCGNAAVDLHRIQQFCVV